MRQKLTTIKNLAWALSIFVMLLSLLLGLLFLAVVRYDGGMERPQVVLGASGSAAPLVDAAETEDPGAPVQTPTGKLIQLEETKDAGQAYIDSLTFLCDSATAGLHDYGILSGGTSTTQVWYRREGTLPVSTLADCQINYPDGSLVSPADAAMTAKPGILVISVGQDGLGAVDQDSFVENYEALIRSIQAKSPRTIIVVCSIIPVGPNYNGTDNLSADLIIRANDWVTRVCRDTGVYYCDAARALRDNTGVLYERFAFANKKTLNSTGLTEFLHYLSTHAVPDAAR